jgi:Flp pilus assembly protein protease CpaA
MLYLAGHLAVAVITDLRSRRIPNRLVLSLAAGGLATALWKACVAATSGPAGSPGKTALQAVGDGAGQVPVSLARMLRPAVGSFMYCVSGSLIVLVFLLLLDHLFPGAVGGGDVKLMAASGLYLGVSGTLRAMVLTFLSGGILSLIMLAFGLSRFREKIPYAPAVAIGVLAAAMTPITS